MNRTLTFAALSLLTLSAAAQESGPPNILWISTEDIGPHLGCYGDEHAKTPALDSLAAKGVRYSRAFTVAPVCAPNRTSIITGVYASTLGMHHMRAGGEGVDRSIKPPLPEGMKPLSESLRDAGYYATNNSKEDYNFPTPDSAWDESSSRAHWRNRPSADTPFFAVFNFTGTHEGSANRDQAGHEAQVARLTEDDHQDPDEISPPPYHPDTPLVRRTWANYHENVTNLDYWVADLLGQLEEDGLADNTIIFFWSDHGAGFPRCKRFLYDSGVHIPLMVYAPPGLEIEGLGAPGSVDGRLVSSIDFAPTVLALAGLSVPNHMQGRRFLGPNLPSERRYVYGARDRMDERYDMLRMVRDKRFKYIRNFDAHRPYNQFMNTAAKSPIQHELERLADGGELRESARWIAMETKPVEELYDTEADPHEINNLAFDPAHRDELFRLRAEQEKWSVDTRDLGLVPEPELVRWDAKYGSRYRAVRVVAAEDPAFLGRLRATASVASKPEPHDEALLLESATSDHGAVRYWAYVGLGQLKGQDGEAAAALEAGLEDALPECRIASAYGTAADGRKVEQAVELLTTELSSDREWVRLLAAIALDELDEVGRPAVGALKVALEDRENKYVVRVANRALNELLGTENLVR